jgi:outer membrane immunogenic protein
MLKKLIGAASLTSLLVVASLGAAKAADLPVKAPLIVPISYSWTGFYIGVNAGGSWGNVSDSVAFMGTGAGATSLPIASLGTRPSGFIGGGQAGYNWQIGTFVWGLETDLQWSGERGSNNVAGFTATCGVPCSVSETDKITWFGTTRLRAGVTWSNWLFYVTGGAAYGGLNTTGTENFVGGAGPLIPLTSATTTRLGYTFGAGVEGQLVGAWSWKAEYLFVDLGRVNYAFAEPAPPFAPGTISQSFRATDNIFRLGVNWHFGGGPIIARY